MERGLLWLPLLIAFFWLAWAGWNEYQKIEAYKHWAESFEQAKYDIYAVLGQKGKIITWGRPTRREPVEIESFSLDDVESINLLVDDRRINSEEAPSKGKPSLEFIFAKQDKSMKVPFTDISLAAKWQSYLQKLHWKSDDDLGN
ncbi:hypothetical protein [Oscillatoria salina]|uniref:hypothetical protein n=1 Tax=Oscillatoria salina TaxID=331517 RepID=UPI0013B5BA42|nr:hypothetical protein [Oscillatoria salina]MBZ8181928.1 hypothetical protein [Oscillatoria salina IIICB1]NET89788.1 hypothetical protein [Kamptonema sp. SIO1D9]